MYFEPIKSKPIYLFLTLFLLFTNPVQANLCRALFTKLDTQSFDPEEVFTRVGFNPEKIILEFTKTPGGDEAPFWELAIKQKTEKPEVYIQIGSMSIWAVDISFKKVEEQVPWKDYNIWRTDTAGVGLQKKGIGQLMYLLMATKFFISFPNKHLISTDHSGSANHMWEALVRKGFAKKFSIDEHGNMVSVSEELGTTYEIDKLALGKIIKDYVR